MLVFLNGVGGEGKNKVLACHFTCDLINRILRFDDGVDEFLVAQFGVVLIVAIEGVRGGSGSFHSFDAEVVIVFIGVGDLEGVKTHVLGRDAVYCRIDGLHLPVGQMEVGRQVVSCLFVCCVEGACGNCVAQIDPEQVGRGQYGIVIYAFPVCDLCGVFGYFPAVSILLRAAGIVDPGVLCEELAEIQGVKLRDVGVFRSVVYSFGRLISGCAGCDIRFPLPVSGCLVRCITVVSLLIAIRRRKSLCCLFVCCRAGGIIIKGTLCICRCRYHRARGAGICCGHSRNPCGGGCGQTGSL